MTKSKYTKEYLEPIIKSSYSWAEVTRKCLLKEDTGSQTYITNKGKALGIDTSHFKLPPWSEGRKKQIRKSLEEYLNVDTKVRSNDLKLKLVNAGLKILQCEICFVSEWQGKTLTFELDHINGINTDNRLENLRILCPNCHSQTPTWRGRKEEKIRKQ